MFSERKRSVSAPKNRSFGGQLATTHAGTRAACLFERDAAHGGARFFFDLRFALRAATPEGKRKTVFHSAFQVLIGFRVVRIALAESQRFVRRGRLSRRGRACGGRGKVGELDTGFPFLGGPVEASQHGSLLGD